MYFFPLIHFTNFPEDIAKMSLFDHNSNEQKNAQQSTHLGDSQGMPHPIDDAKKLMAEVAGIVRDIRKMVDKASRAMRIMGEP